MVKESLQGPPDGSGEEEEETSWSHNDEVEEVEEEEETSMEYDPSEEGDDDMELYDSDDEDDLETRFRGEIEGIAVLAALMREIPSSDDSQGIPSSDDSLGIPSSDDSLGGLWSDDSDLGSENEFIAVAEEAELVGTLANEDEDSDVPEEPFEREVLGRIGEPTTSLHAAAVRGDARALRRWQAWRDGKWARKVKGDTALHCAARSGDVATVEQLLSEGAPVGAINEQRRTALEVAALSGHVAVVKVILGHAVPDDDWKDNDNWKTLRRTLVAAKSSAVVRAVVERSKTAVEGVAGAAILYHAVESGRVALLKAALEAGADPNSPLALHKAASMGHTKCVKLLLEFKANPLKKDSSRWTALHSASHNGHAEVVKMLLAAGADVYAKTDEGQTAFNLAKCDIVKKLITNYITKQKRRLADILVPNKRS